MKGDTNYYIFGFMFRACVLLEWFYCALTGIGMCVHHSLVIYFSLSNEFIAYPVNVSNATST